MHNTHLHDLHRRSHSEHAPCIYYENASAMILPALPPLREVIAAHGLRARKSLGQNFLLDLNLTRKIARIAGPLGGKLVFEIGPGPGGLTRALLEENAHVIAVERDARCIAALSQLAVVAERRLDIIAADALKTDFQALANGRRCLIVANLPYNIATPLLINWLLASPWPPFYDAMVLMFQKEVAQRITASPGSKAYGRLSVLAQWRTTPKIALQVPASAFTPEPKVNSAMVTFAPVTTPLACAGDDLARVTAAAFGQRRKMLRSSLKSLLPGPEKILEKLGIDASKRAEELEVAQFCAIANQLSSNIKT